jgi:protein TonB
MKDMPPIDAPALLRLPIARALMLSLCLHLAILALVHPSPGSSTPRTVIISARLDTAEPETIVAKATAMIQPPESPLEPSEAATAPEPQPLALPRESPPLLPPLPASLPAIPSPTAPASPPSPAPVAAPVAVAPLPPASVGPTSPSSLPSLPLGIDTTWYQARQVDSHPKAIGRIEPVYPEEARRGSVEGSLKLMVKIDDLGRVIAAEVVEARPPGIFDRAALDAFRDARFQPAIKDGRPVRYQAYMRVDFKLEN